MARLDSKLDRATATLQINGFWLENHASVAAPEFYAALGRGLHSFAVFLNAPRISLDAITPARLRTAVRKQLRGALDVVPG